MRDHKESRFPEQAAEGSLTRTRSLTKAGCGSALLVAAISELVGKALEVSFFLDPWREANHVKVLIWIFLSSFVRASR